MRAPPPNTKLYWFAGGEILAAGGEHPLTMRDPSVPSPGCRPVPISEARRLADSLPRLAVEATKAGDTIAADYFERAGADIAAAVAQASQLRAA